MPVIKCANGKYRIGNGPCQYPSKAVADRMAELWMAESSSEERSASDRDERGLSGN